ncbi:hypothetical protein VI817_009832 [Penicillium citrinum]|nr:hypothetical protein VI817_009832 [Penicillium citrinum]
MSRRNTSTRLFCLSRSVSMASSSAASSELLREPRETCRTNDGHGLRRGNHASPSTLPLAPMRSPFRGRSGGAGRPLNMPVLSSSASVPLSLGVRDDLE